ncbi:type II toxin-antitoxin system RelE/ParE family toxin [Colwellia sp. KU-HH00111]|uniref:type II toxin-antitoxin system RelE family toxin n=1 Tax=Colwellia sp. KU-HH00111 TaxID=3127652 RepID=UPI00310BD9FE
MSYELVFKQDALKEWRKLDSMVRNQFKKKLIERLDNPKIESSRLNGMKDCYKIKLRKAGYRLVYQVRDLKVIVSIVAVGKTEKNAVYKIAAKRL